MREEWKERRLDEVFDIARGGSPRPIKDFITESDDSYNWVKIGDTKNTDKFIYSTKQKIRKEGLKKSLLVKENDFILSNSMSFGKPYIMKTEGCIHDGWLLMRRKSEELSIDYMYYLLSSDVIKSQFKSKAAGSTVQNLNIKLVSTVKALIPSSTEQQKIAEILSTVDAKIDLITQRISQTQDLKKGLMQRLLTKGIGHTQFKDSPLGEIPKSWEYVKLNEICNEIFLGLTSKVDYVEKGGFPFIRATDINTGSLSFKNVRYISETQHKKLTSRRITKKGDVLVSKSGTLGTCAIVDVDIEFSTYESIITIQPKAELLSNKFLLQILQDTDVQKRMIGARVGGIVGHLNLMTFRKLVIPLPKINEQIRISEILSTVDSKLDVLQNKKTHYQDLKKGLMQQLLTGKVRVTGLIKEAV
ncbi:restriction endonuclease subunit S [Tenacibaculum bernardetii]|uniref:restriction endonuclease subunit S n=1 Tax=Tenacibaculum bernardetii TaxID=3021375 RepID=UPI0023AE8628|nr:restriction endonuclease subunit S [Tenacibaculum bernardetii]